MMNNFNGLNLLRLLRGILVNEVRLALIRVVGQGLGSGCGLLP